MNYLGSYRHLLRNSRSALLAAIELYNKPRIEYRDETVVILMLNAWELILKAMLSRRRQSIFYPKKRGQPYKTLSWGDAFERARQHFPSKLEALPVRRNLDLLALYRDNAVHYYNAKAFRTLLYGLTQTAVLNYRDLLQQSFDLDIAEEMTLRLLPIGIDLPVDPLEYLRKASAKSMKGEPAVREFLAQFATYAGEIEAAKADSGRLLTPVVLKLVSTKKLEKADLVVGVEKATAEGEPIIIERPTDPNKSHPLRQKGILERITKLHEKPFTSHTLQAIVWKHKMKANNQYCWMDAEYGFTKYSLDAVTFIRQLTDADLSAALKDYGDHMKRRAAARRSGKALE